MLIGKFEFLSAPKMEISGTGVKLALFSSPQNAQNAKKFCQLYLSNGKLYHLEHNWKNVVEFASTNGINTFYISLNDNTEENKFIYGNGSQFPEEFSHLWNQGEPDNYIPPTHHFCEGTPIVSFLFHFYFSITVFYIIGSGEDNIIFKNGKLSDVNGYRKFPYICQYDQNYIINEELPICFNCSEFIEYLNINSLIPKFIIHFHVLCKNELLNIFEAKATLMCNIVGEFLHKSLDFINMKFFESNEFCKYLSINNCTLKVIDNCIKCKTLASQFKRKTQDIQLNHYIGKYLPYLTNFLLFLCTELSIDCKHMNMQQAIQDMMFSQLENNEFSSIICSSIDMCEA